jgi:hypothetical protein
MVVVVGNEAGGEEAVLEPSFGSANYLSKAGRMSSACAFWECNCSRCPAPLCSQSIGQQTEAHAHKHTRKNAHGNAEKSLALYVNSFMYSVPTRRCANSRPFKAADAVIA